jgi:hypothetical protein
MKHLVLILCLACMSTTTFGQLPEVSTGLFMGDTTGPIEVRVKPTGGFNGLYSASSFTIRWPVATALKLDSISQPNAATPWHVIGKQGPEAVEGHYRYQKFAGFGLNTLSAAGSPWLKDSQYTILFLHFSGSPRIGTIELVNDSWTTNQNADNYHELAGYDRTAGLFNDIVTLNVDLNWLSAQPVENRDALVTWSTAGEFGTSQYDVLRSSNLTDWTVVETVSGAHYSALSSSYEITDPGIHPNDHTDLTVFYKLRLVNLDGTTKEYGPRAVTFTRDPSWAPHNVFPNPANAFVYLEAPIEWGDLRYEIKTELSQQVLKGTLQPGGGSVDITSMPEGIIVVQAFDLAGRPVISRPIIHVTHH